MAKKPINNFGIIPNEESMQRERRKARELRVTQWWKRRLAHGECHYCHRKTLLASLTMDHIVPVARGGRTTKGNVVPCCKECNTKKKYLLLMEWEEYLEDIRKRSTDDC